MREIARRLTVERNAFDTKLFQQSGHDYAAHRIDGIEHDLEAGLAHSFGVYRFQGENGIYVLVRKVVLFYLAEFIDIGEVELSPLGTVQDRLALGRRQELSAFVEKFERIPLTGIVGRRYYYSAVCVRETHRQFRGGGGCEAALHDIHSACDKGSAYKVFDHAAADSGIAPDHYFVFFCVWSLALPKFAAICVGKLYDVYRGEGLSGHAAYGTPDSGNRFDKCHRHKYTKKAMTLSPLFVYPVKNYFFLALYL